MVQAVEREGRGEAARSRDCEVRYFWASAEGIDQVGYVYTAQGIKVDYVGVIFGPISSPADGRGWVGHSNQSHDRVVRRGASEAEFTRYVKSTYRVLLTRGLRGCYVYFMDTPTRDFFLNRTERSSSQPERVAEVPAPYEPSESKSLERCGQATVSVVEVASGAGTFKTPRRVPHSGAHCASGPA